MDPPRDPSDFAFREEVRALVRDKLPLELVKRARCLIVKMQFGL